MRKVLLVGFVLSIFFSFCSSDKTETGNKLSYSCGIDNIIHWSGKDECKKQKGHTGEYCGYVDSTNEYGFGFLISFSEIFDKHYKKIIFKSWILSDNPSSQVTLSLSIEKDGTFFLWKGIKVTDFMQKKNEWFQVVGIAEIPNNEPKDANVLMYVSSPDKSSALADDFEISFE